MKQRFLFLTLISISFFFLSCDPPEAFFPDITLQSTICSKETGSPISGIYISLYNDSVSSNVLAYEATNSNGLAYITFVEVPDVNKKYNNLEENEYPCESLSPIKEQIQTSEETTSFYLMVNDSLSEYYNKKYESKKIFLNSFNTEYYEKSFYLSIKKN